MPRALGIYVLGNLPAQTFAWLYYLYSFKFVLITFGKRVCFCIPTLRACFIYPVTAVRGIAVGAEGLPR